VGTLETTIKDLQSEVKENTSRIDTVDEAEACLRAEHEKVVAILMSFGEIEQSIRQVARLGEKVPILEEYLGWIHRRYKDLLRLPFQGVIEAPDPDYFGFAAMFFRKAKKSVRSTSLVDPHWYDSDECIRYIRNQVDELINKHQTYTRYFIVNPTLDTAERRSKTVSVIKSQAEKGFNVAVVHTANYEREYDAAVIDDGALWVLAKVPKESHLNLPEPEITGCRCFFKVDPEYEGLIRKLQGYFDGLESRVHVRFNTSNRASVSMQAVY
jgi:hypothetical protein